MTTATAVEDAILKQLAPLRDRGLIVNALPDTSAVFSQVMSAAELGLITLVFKDDEPSPQVASVDGHIYRRAGQIYMRLRHLDGQAGADILKEDIRTALNGFAPPRCSRLEWGGWKADGRTADLYLFEAAIRCWEVH
jgi:hypothetical protein